MESDRIPQSSIWTPLSELSRTLGQDGSSRKRSEYLRSRRMHTLFGFDIAGIIVSVAGAYWLAALVRHAYDLPQSPSHFDSLVSFVFMVGVGMMVVCSLAWSWGHYTRFRPFWTEMFEILKAVFYLAAISVGYMFAVKLQFSRLWVICSLLILIVAIPAGRYLSRQYLRRKGWWLKPTCIVGTGSNAVRTAKALASDSWMGHEVVGFVDLENNIPENSVICDLPVNRVLPNAAGDCEGREKTCVVFALDSSEQMHDYRHEINRYIVASSYATVSPPIHGLPLYGAEIVSVYRHDSVIVKLQNNINRQSSRVCKRAFDLGVSSMLLIVLSPLLIGLFLLIRRDGGKALYGHKRIGRHGVAFHCLKFRSMVLDADKELERYLSLNPERRLEWELNHKLKDDPRVTPVGHFIRRTSLDELPQLWNVIRGEMSLVGPRPIVMNECEKYGEHLPYYLSMLPGITGLWQSSGRSDTEYTERVSLDVWYARNWSLWHDFVILLRTPFSLLKSQGAY
ncbi:undecaprenyl-phosphate galactose phosphotransferase WbaP [Granulosicoccus sp. 3-233]|uniref:undecaprenyl-phosphate galactose phosphotransferase WbaP n=1 Tax=Granulosicoccus sp. 3-233 TaxID=3417969 RepID=UPI003D334FEA